MYSTCIVWMAFIPIFFGTNHDYTVSQDSVHSGSFDKLFTKLWREVTLIQTLVNFVLLQGVPGISGDIDWQFPCLRSRSPAWWCASRCRPRWPWPSSSVPRCTWCCSTRRNVPGTTRATRNKTINRYYISHLTPFLSENIISIQRWILNIHEKYSSSQSAICKALNEILIFQLKFSKSRESNVTFLECEENNGNNGVHWYGEGWRHGI